jgi:ferric-dicitrate binding protein FerR (iron transport regulator)
MNKSNTRLGYLLQRFHAQTASQEELTELMQLLNSKDVENELHELWQQVPEQDRFFSEETSEQILASLLQKQPSLQQPATIHSINHRSPVKRWFAVAAAFALLASAGWIFYLSSSRKAPAEPIAAAPVVITPGGNKATLTLSNGSAILLDSAQNGDLALQGNINIRKVDGQVVYKNGQEKETSSSLAYNTLTTPKGGQYQLVLSDGTKVWMNAASSLRYPAAFTGADRTVELNGEAYFEVAKNPSKPFRVLLNGMDVQVLGTHFNVMAYENESAIKTTLLEGSVRVNSDAQHAQLSPGQQVQHKPNTDFKVVNDVDVEEVVAWKNGYFQFNRDGLDVVMRQIERWYDVEVAYVGKISERQFGGKISRSSNIEDVLKILRLSNVSFRIEGKKIIVTNKS